MPIYRVNILQSLLAQQMMNVLYYDVDDTLSSGQALEIADTVRSAYAAAFSASELSNGWSYDAIEVRRVDLVDQPTLLVQPTAGPLGGTQAADPLPTQIALLVRGSAFAPFPRTVRSYVPGVTEADLNAGLFTTGIRDAAVTFFETIDSMNLTGANAGRVAATVENLGAGSLVTDFNRITDYVGIRIPATQRRRRIGVGV